MPKKKQTPNTAPPECGYNAIAAWVTHHEIADSQDKDVRYYTTEEIQDDLAQVVELEINYIAKILTDCVVPLAVAPDGRLGWKFKQ